MSYVLGLDLGPSSIGWAAVNIDGNGDYKGLAQIPDGKNSIPAIGARIFPAGVENYGQGLREETRNKNRREKRSVRRTLRRRRIRRLKLVSLLEEKGILPADNEKVNTLQTSPDIDPYEIRARALKEKIKLEELGRILLHICKRRGFKSNRKSPPKKEEHGKIKDAQKRLNEALNGKTLGEFWHEKRTQNKLTSIRNRLGNYQWIATRGQYEDEFEKIWERQQKEYPQLLTNEFKKQISAILFKQITYEQLPGKMKKMIGQCSLLPKEKRCPLSNRKAQEFRCLQKINDLLIVKRGKQKPLSPEQRQAIIDILNTEEKPDFKKIQKKLNLEEDERFNFEFEDDAKLQGNETDAQLSKLFGKDIWLGFNEKIREQIWQTVIEYINNEHVKEDETVQRIEHICGQKIEKTDKLPEITLPDGYVKFCEKVLDKILPFMRKGLQYYDAVKNARFKISWAALDKLSMPDREHGFYITNPNVSTVLFQVHKLVNRLIAEIGKPERIVVEFTREIKADKERRQNILKLQTERRKAKERIAEEIKQKQEWDGPDKIPNWAIEKYLLWDEQNTLSPYSGSGKSISLSELFSRKTEIDHILPYSMTLDDSLSNKVVCFASENQEKGQRTPFDWLGHNEEKWQIVQQTIDHWKPQRKTRGRGKDAKSKADTKVINARKWEKFFITADQIEEVYEPERYLVETGYIAKEVREYLESLYEPAESKKKVRTTKGGVTSQLRKWWDLNRILGVDESNGEKDEQGNSDKKNRGDLRHHSIDAAVIAVTEPKLVKKVTSEIQRCYPRKSPRDIYVPRPWQNFEDEIKQAMSDVNISHRTQRKVKGELHGQTHYWKETNGKYAGKYITTKSLNSLSDAEVKRICDEKIKKMAEDKIREFEGNIKKAFDQPLLLPNKNGEPIPVRKVRICTDKTDKNMMFLKKGLYYVERPENHHIEIFKLSIKGKTKYICKTWDMWDITKRIRNCQPIYLKKHPDYPEAKFVMSLCKGETIELDGTAQKRVLARIKEVGADKNNGLGTDIKLWEVEIGRLDEKITKSTPKAYRIQSINELLERNAKKVIVDLLGRVRWAND
jgi:CRISPR-associated endonuclease Csn1